MKSQVGRYCVIGVFVVALLFSVGQTWGMIAFDNLATNQVVYPYESNPSTYASYGYQANGIAEVGDYIQLAPGAAGRTATRITIGLSSFTTHAAYPTWGDATGYDHPITLNLYQPGALTNGATAGALIMSVTDTVHVPWWSGTVGSRVNFLHTFDVSSLNVSLPSDVVYGVAYNTETWGYSPTGTNGPYNALNYGVSLNIAGAWLPWVGTNPHPATNFFAGNWNGDVLSYEYDDVSGYGPLIQVLVLPEPSSMILLAVGALVVWHVRRRG